MIIYNRPKNIDIILHSRENRIINEDGGSKGEFVGDGWGRKADKSLLPSIYQQKSLLASTEMSIPHKCDGAIVSVTA